MTATTGRRPAVMLGLFALAGLLVRVLVAHASGVFSAPALAGDLVDGLLVWALAARIAPPAALRASAFVFFNPAIIALSAWLGDVDSLWWAFALAGVLLALRIDGGRPLARLACAGAGLAVPLSAFALSATAFPYTSVNAFNLYATRGRFWQPDTLASSPLFTPLAVGALLFAGSLVLIVTRYRERPDDRALLEASLLAAFASFLFLTRMHEGGAIGALLLALPLFAAGGRFTLAVWVLSCTALLDAAYAGAYRSAIAVRPAGVDLADLWPAISHPAALFNVALFFVLGYAFMAAERDDDPVRGLFARAWFRARDWFSPREGFAAMTRRDWLFAAGFALAAFVLSVAWVQYPAERIFDEVYYPRAGEEYLKHLDISGHGPFEFTHPPLTKLLIALSMLLFGGLHGLGDTALGWRFLNVVVGALLLPLAYAFTKRLTGSSLAAALAATLLLFDGFRYVQARIATPEITVAVLALAVLYAFYRLWTANDVRVHVSRERGPSRGTFAAVLAGGLALAALAGWLLPALGPRRFGAEWIAPTRAVVFAYVAIVAYLAASIASGRAGRITRTQASYADGTLVRREAKAAVFSLLDGEQVTGGTRDAVRSGNGWTRRFERDGSERYDTPDGGARYGTEGVVAVDGGAPVRLAPLRWTVVLALACGLLLASKWNGILDPIVVALIAGFVLLQRYAKRPALYGNPFGIRLDVLAAWIVAVSGAIYLLCYIPYFTLGHNLVDLVEMQYDMYQYHHNLVATHPYASPWWQWPLLLKPISYYYSAFEPYKTSQIPTDCCVAEILALPNPLVWWTGLISVPFVGFLAWKERSRGFLLLVVAYVMQWLPWAASPRIAFEYHFFPNLAIIAICDAILLHRVWLLEVGESRRLWTKTAVAAYVLAAIVIFAFFYPLLAGTHIPYDAWRARMWIYPGWV